MNGLDTQVVLFLNQFMNRWPWFDSMMKWVTGAELVKGGAIMVLFWYTLFDRAGADENSAPNELLLGVAALSPFAVVCARALALCLPFRSRPFESPAIRFQLPPHWAPALPGWSSFPSDHAVLFFMLATGIFFVSRATGWLALGWTTAVIAFPRLYMGIHWPTDLLAGALLGAGFAQAVKITAIRKTVQRAAARLYGERRGLFFALLFLLSYQIAGLFLDSRRLAAGVWRLVSH